MPGIGSLAQDDRNPRFQNLVFTPLLIDRIGITLKNLSLDSGSIDTSVTGQLLRRFSPALIRCSLTPSYPISILVTLAKIL